jgi:hypothetical protein
MAFGFHGAGKACGVLETAAYSTIGEHLQKPHNDGSRPQTQFFNTPLKFFPASADILTGSNPAERLEMVS